MNPEMAFLCVQHSFEKAVADPDIRRWKSMSEFAGGVALAFARNDNFFMAACMDGVAEYAKRQQLAMQPKAVA